MSTKVTEVQQEKTLSYCHFVGELLERNSLFAPKEFKLICALVKRLDYSLSNFSVAISLAELQELTGLGKGAVLSALSHLQGLGLVEKISGKYDKELAYHIRGEIYQKPQRKTRAVNEVNIYNLSALYSFIQEVVAFDEQAKLIFLDLYGYRLKPIDYPSRLLPKLRRYIYRKAEEQGVDVRFTYQDLLDFLKSPEKIDQSDLKKIDLSDWSKIDHWWLVYIDRKPRSKEKPILQDHTHTTKEQRLEKEKKTTSQGIVSQQVNQKTKATQGIKPFDKIKNEELRQFILDYLESSPSVQNPLAVAKSLSEEDIEYYYKLFKRHKQTQKNVQEKTQKQEQKENKELLVNLLKFAKTLFDKGEESIIYQRFFKDGIRYITEEEDKLIVVCNEYVDQYLEREFGAKIRKWAGKPVEFTT